MVPGRNLESHTNALLLEFLPKGLVHLTCQGAVRYQVGVEARVPSLNSAFEYGPADVALACRRRGNYQALTGFEHASALGLFIEGEMQVAYVGHRQGQCNTASHQLPSS